LVTVPLTVNEAEPLAPAVKLNPAVDARVNVPSETESVSESAFVPAAASVIASALLFPLESVKEPFSLREPPPGPEIAGAAIGGTLPDTLFAGGLTEATVIDTLVEADRLSLGSETDADKESAPE
jgi:hypothetical protein